MIMGNTREVCAERTMKRTQAYYEADAKHTANGHTFIDNERIKYDSGRPKQCVCVCGSMYYLRSNTIECRKRDDERADCNFAR